MPSIESSYKAQGLPDPENRHNARLTGIKFDGLRPPKPSGMYGRVVVPEDSLKHAVKVVLICSACGVGIQAVKINCVNRSTLLVDVLKSIVMMSCPKAVAEA